MLYCDRLYSIGCRVSGFGCRLFDSQFKFISLEMCKNFFNWLLTYQEVYWGFNILNEQRAYCIGIAMHCIDSFQSLLTSFFILHSLPLVNSLLLSLFSFQLCFFFSFKTRFVKVNVVIENLSTSQFCLSCMRFETRSLFLPVYSQWTRTRTHATLCSPFTVCVSICEQWSQRHLNTEHWCE